MAMRSSSSSAPTVGAVCTRLARHHAVCVPASTAPREPSQQHQAWRRTCSNNGLSSRSLKDLGICTVRHHQGDGSHAPPERPSTVGLQAMEAMSEMSCAHGASPACCHARPAGVGACGPALPLRPRWHTYGTRGGAPEPHPADEEPLQGSPRSLCRPPAGRLPPLRVRRRRSSSIPPVYIYIKSLI